MTATKSPLLHLLREHVTSKAHADKYRERHKVAPLQSFFAPVADKSTAIADMWSQDASERRVVDRVLQASRVRCAGYWEEMHNYGDFVGTPSVLLGDPQCRRDAGWIACPGDSMSKCFRTVGCEEDRWQHNEAALRIIHGRKMCDGCAGIPHLKLFKRLLRAHALAEEGGAPVRPKRGPAEAGGYSRMQTPELISRSEELQVSLARATRSLRSFQSIGTRAGTEEWLQRLSKKTKVEVSRCHFHFPELSALVLRLQVYPQRFLVTDHIVPSSNHMCCQGQGDSSGRGERHGTLCRLGTLSFHRSFICNRMLCMQVNNLLRSPKHSLT